MLGVNLSRWGLSCNKVRFPEYCQSSLQIYFHIIKTIENFVYLISNKWTTFCFNYQLDADFRRVFDALLSGKGAVLELGLPLSESGKSCTMSLPQSSNFKMHESYQRCRFSVLRNLDFHEKVA